MARYRSKPYRVGDKFTVQIPLEADKALIKWINNQKYLSPSVIDVLTAHALKTLPTYKNKENDTNKN